MIFTPVYGGGLNFEIVGGTEQPTNPKENTIWVNTEHSITSWAFSLNEPKSTDNGMVWFKIGQSKVSFNALKQNTIQVNLNKAQQFVSGKWESVEFTVYQDGAWTDAGLVLYNYGDECTDVTGGWVFSHARWNGDTMGEKGQEALISTCGHSDSNKVIFTTLNAVDVTEYTKLRAVFTRVTDMNTRYNGEYGHAIGLRNSALPSGNIDSYGYTANALLNSGYSESVAFDAEEHSLELSLDGMNGTFYVSVFFGSCSCTCKYIVLE